MKKEKSEFPSKQRISRRGLWGGRPQYILSKPIQSAHDKWLQRALLGSRVLLFQRFFVTFRFRLLLMCEEVTEFTLTDVLLPRLFRFCSIQICIGFGMKAKGSAPNSAKTVPISSDLHHFLRRWHSSDWIWRCRFNLRQSASWFLAGRTSYFIRMTKKSGDDVGCGKKVVTTRS